MIYSLLTSIIFSLIAAAGMEAVIYYREEHLLANLIITFVILIIGAMVATKFKAIKKDKFYLILLPIMFIAAALSYLIFQEGRVFRHIYVAVVAVFFFVSLYLISRKFSLGAEAEKPLVTSTRPNTREIKEKTAASDLKIEKPKETPLVDQKSPAREFKLSFIEIFILVTAFLSFSSLFGFFLFFGLPLWLLMLAVFVLALILTFLDLSESGHFNLKNFLFALICAFIMVELAWVLSYWPSSIVSRGIVLFTFFYLFTGITKHHFQDLLTGKVVREYLIVSSLILLLVLGTTEWTY